MPNIFIFLLIAFCFSSCQSKKKTNKEANETNKEEVKKEESNPEKGDIKLQGYNRLDDIDVAAMKRNTSEKKEEGDCESHTTKYQNKTMALVIDSVDCFDYGKTFTYFLLNKNGEITKVHEKEVTPYYEEKNGEAEFYISLSEVFINYDVTPAKVTSKTDTILRSSIERKVVYDKNYKSEPWIVLSEKGDDLLIGEKIDFSGDWYEVSKNKLKARLSKMEKLPLEIPMESKGTVGMGHRGEFRSMCKEAIEEVAAEIENTAANPFTHLKKEFSKVENADEKAAIEYWEKRYQSAIQ